MRSIRKYFFRVAYEDEKACLYQGDGRICWGSDTFFIHGISTSGYCFNLADKRTIFGRQYARSLISSAYPCIVSRKGTIVYEGYTHIGYRYTILVNGKDYSLCAPYLYKALASMDPFVIEARRQRRLHRASIRYARKIRGLLARMRSGFL